MDSGLMGGIIGGTIGVLGGLLGTYFSIKNTKSRRERTFVLWAALSMWLFVGTFTTVILLYPQLWMMIPYCLVMTLGILFLNKKQMAIRRSEDGPEAHG